MSARIGDVVRPVAAVPGRTRKLSQAVRAAILAGALGGGMALGLEAGEPEFQDYGLGLFVPEGRREPQSVTLVDLDADRDPDLLVWFARPYADAGRVFRYENTGTIEFPYFSGPTSYRIVGDAEANAGYVDLDGDGDLDLLTFESGRPWFYENQGSSKAPQYAPPLSDPFGLAGMVAPGRESRLEFADIDADGDPDLMYLASAIGEGLNKFVRVLHYFENVGSAQAPAFAPGSVQDLGLPVTFPDPAPVSRARVELADLDADGDLDVVFDCQSLWENTGTASSPLFQSQALDHRGGCADDFADLDGDGDADGLGVSGLLFDLSENLYAGNGFSVQPAALLVLAPYAGMVRPPGALGDLDGDGDLDFLFGDDTQFLWHENLGGPDLPMFDQAGQEGPFGLAGLVQRGDPQQPLQLLDIDADGDLDVILSEDANPGCLGYLKNAGDPRAPWFEDPPVRLGCAETQTMLLGDVTGDSASDLFAFSQDQWHWAENKGTPEKPLFWTDISLRFVFEEAPLIECDPLARGCDGADLIDLDLDGDLDIATKTGDWFRNQTLGADPWFELQAANPVGGGLYGDLDGDGDPDLLREGRLFENRDESAAPPRQLYKRGRTGLGTGGVNLGFTIEGPSPQTVVIQGLGPSIADPGTAVVADPRITLYSDQGAVAFNDDWEARPEQGLIAAAGLAPGDSREAALMVRLAPGRYYVNLDAPSGASGLGEILVIEAPYDYGWSRLLAMEPVLGVINLSTRGQVEPSYSLHGGFVIRGHPKTVLIRGLGETLTDRGLTGVLPDPQLQLYHYGQVIASSNDWRDSGGCGGTGLEPSYANEPCIRITLEPGPYTALLSDADGGAGKAIVSVNDLGGEGTVINLSTRGLVLPGEEPLTGGFVIRGETAEVLVRALGPTLADRGVADALADPLLTLYSGQTPIASSDGWRDGDCAGTGLEPAYDEEPCIRLRLPPGPYTAVVTSAAATAGEAIVSVNPLGR